MDPSPDVPDHDALARALIEQILMTGVMLADLVTDLLDGLPEDAFPGENPAEVLLEMLAGSSVSAVRDAGAEHVERTIALIHAAGDRVLTDLRTAAELAEAREGSNAGGE